SIDYDDGFIAFLNGTEILRKNMGPPGLLAYSDQQAFNAFKDYIAQHLPDLSTQKLYFDHGDKTLDAMYPDLQIQIDAIFKQQYPQSLWQSKFFKGENHSEKSWAKRLHIPLEFMFAK
ncbi:MAG: hypothetical protein QNK26_02920, partial [Moritella sp.]|nr:hypothetical protein [Moritella sp.]